MRYIVQNKDSNYIQTINDIINDRKNNIFLFFNSKEVALTFNIYVYDSIEELVNGLRKRGASAAGCARRCVRRCSPFCPGRPPAPKQATFPTRCRSRRRPPPRAAPWTPLQFIKKLPVSANSCFTSGRLCAILLEYARYACKLPLP